jgi:ankyrin repeat protein
MDDEIKKIAPSKAATMQQIKFQREVNERSLRNAADKGDIDEVRRLLGLRGANNQDQISPNAADVAGHTALHFAAYGGHEYVVEELISTDATDLFMKTDVR